jgi:polyvinyl alcohol dehydrogenase (cytochrome)
MLPSPTCDLARFQPGRRARSPRHSAFRSYSTRRPAAGSSRSDARTGIERWYTPHPGCINKPGCSPAQSAAVTAIPSVVFSGGLDGHLRAYTTTDGTIVWDVDTERGYDTVNAVKANGGSLDGPGPTVAGGMLYVESGYDFLGTAPGNVLLAFSIDGK